MDHIGSPEALDGVGFPPRKQRPHRVHSRCSGPRADKSRHRKRLRPPRKTGRKFDPKWRNTHHRRRMRRIRNACLLRCGRPQDRSSGGTGAHQLRRRDRRPLQGQNTV
jgi:hypothetical protein